MSYRPEDLEQYDISPDAQAALAAGYLATSEALGEPTTEELEEDRERIVEKQAWGD